MTLSKALRVFIIIALAVVVLAGPLVLNLVFHSAGFGEPSNFSFFDRGQAAPSAILACSDGSSQGGCGSG